MSFLRQGRTSNKNFLSERVGDLNTPYELSWLFKPVTNMQKDLKEGLVSELKPIREGMKSLPKAITFPQFPSITDYDDDGEEEVDVFIGDIAEQYLRKFAFASGADKTFGLRDNDSKFYVGNMKAKIKDYNIIVGDWEYVGTPVLWKLIVATTPDDKIFTTGDYDNYAEIMHSTNALSRNNDESEIKPKANRVWKWKHILKPIWDEKDLYPRNGITPSALTIVLQCDQRNLSRRKIRYTDGNKAAGNTGVRNELVSVCDELLRQNLIDKRMYKIIMLQL